MPIVNNNGLASFEYRHVVCFEETNVVGNVYYGNHVLWQGRCREMFLREYCPEVTAQIAEGLSLVTLRVSCEYIHELYAFDQIAMRMRVAWQRQNRMALDFDYIRLQGDGDEELVAQGEQQVACLAVPNGNAGNAEPRPFPHSILQTIEKHGLMATGQRARKLCV